jgi:hypothetical protein
MFTERLLATLRNFSTKAASELTDEIHEAEANGYQISNLEDRLWLRLTDRILRFQE